MPAVSTLALDSFLTDTTAHVICALREQVQQTKGSGAIEVDSFDPRFASMARLLASVELSESAVGRPQLERAVRGYLSEFLRQTLDQPGAYTPQTTEISRSGRMDFWSTNLGSDIEWSASLLIVRHSVRLFKEDWAATFPDIPPRASVYNEYERLSYGVMLERHHLILNRAP